MGRKPEAQQLSLPLISFEQMAEQVSGLSLNSYNLIVQRMIETGQTDPMQVFQQLHAEASASHTDDIVSSYR